MRSHQPPSMEALDANVENPEDKYHSKTECTSGSIKNYIYLLCSFFTVTPIILHQCGSRVLFSSASYFFMRPLLQCSTPDIFYPSAKYTFWTLKV